MASVYITEFGDPRGAHGLSGVAPLPALAEQKISITSSNVESAAFNSATKLIRVHADAICSILVANSGTATATAGKLRLAAGQTEYFAVNSGAKLGVIENT